MTPRNTNSARTLLAVAILLILIAGLRPIGIDRDSLNYEAMIQAPLEAHNFLINEPLYMLIIQINALFFNAESRTFFLVFAILGVGAKMYAIKRVATYPVLSVITYIFLYFVLHEMTQIRVGVAAGIFLASIPDIASRNLRAFLFKMLLAMAFHYSAILMLPIYFINARTFNRYTYFALPIVGMTLAVATSLTMPLVGALVGMLPESIGYKLNIYLLFLTEDDQSTISLFNPFYVSLTVLYIFLVAKYNLLRGDYDILMLKIFGFSLLAYFSLSFVPVFSFRVAEFWSVVLIALIPNALRMFSGRIVPALVVTTWMIGYFLAIMIGQNLAV
jgi:hypothetical protein